jgi:hypothetical protein
MVMDELGELLGESPAIEMVRDKLRRLLDAKANARSTPSACSRLAAATSIPRSDALSRQSCAASAW